MQLRTVSVFNSPLETGIRSTAILLAAYPHGFDLQRLVAFDYFVVHTEDLGGPPSLHPKTPLRTGELLVRRKAIERSLLLMIAANMVYRKIDEYGVIYYAGEAASVFFNNISTEYNKILFNRAS